ncbi:MAG: hypothetical protein ACRD12_23260 [Acidimicrobiales bacterium]
MSRRAALALVLALAAGACGGQVAASPPSSGPPPPSEPPPIGLTKTSDILVQTALQVIGARARGASGDQLAALSTPVVHVRADGAVEVAIHADRVVGDTELEALRRAGVQVVTTATTPAVPGQAPTSVVQAWVPAEKLPVVSGLAWIASITPPAYGITDGGG